MEHAEQVRILKGLMQHLDEGTNVDAGKVVKNPVSSYLCADRGKLEWECFFADYPQVLGLSGDLPAENSFFTSNDFEKPILCTRDKDGKFHAFINACRHRGTIVETEDRGIKSSFSCPFHAWTYSGKGDLVAVPKEDHFGKIDKSRFSLVPLPAEEKYGILWVHPNPDGELKIDEQLGELASELSSWNLESMTRDASDRYEHAMNWKLAIDTFGETYHFNVLHKDTLAQSFYGNAQMYDTYERNHRMTLCMKDIDTLRTLPEDQWNVLVGTTPVYYLFPNTQLILTQAGPILVRVYPRGENPNDSYSEIAFYLRPEIVALKDQPEHQELALAISDRLKGFGDAPRFHIFESITEIDPLTKFI